MADTVFPFWAAPSVAPAPIALSRALDLARPIRVEALGYEEAARHREAWLILIRNALEANAFLEPSFLLPAAQHLAQGRRPVFLFVWDDRAAHRPALIGLCPVLIDPHARTVTAWRHDYAAAGAPLLDFARAPLAVRALLDWVARHTGACGLMLPMLAEFGPTAEILRDCAEEESRELRFFDGCRRAILPRGAHGWSGLRAKGLKELRRQRRRLAERGALTFTSAREPAAVRAAIERFMALEARGWKGARGTALLCRTNVGAFARVCARELGREHKCRIDALELDGAPIAMGIVLESAGRAFFWKCAYDEAYAAFSPGVLLTQDISRVQREQPGVERTDSCAVEGHPMISRLWRHRVSIADVFIGARPADAGMRRMLAREALRRRVRAALKRLWLDTRAALRR